MLDKSLIDNLKRVDPDRYRAAMLAPSQKRQDLLTLYAFHAELAKIPEIVSETMIGNIRYQWWRDALGEIYAGKHPRAHEVVAPLAEMISRRKLSRFHFDQLIDARERDLDPTPFTSLEDAKDYCAKTSGLLAVIAASCAEVNDARAQSLGTLWGLTGLARSWKHYTNGMLSSLNFTDLISHIRSELEREQSSGKLPAQLVPVIGYAALIHRFLGQMAKDGYDPKTMTPSYSPFRKKIRVMSAALTGKI